MCGQRIRMGCARPRARLRSPRSRSHLLTAETTGGNVHMAKLRHVAINCENLDESAKFYAEAFEMEEVGRVGDMEKGGAVYLSDGVVNVALIKITDPNFPNYKPDGL